MHSFTVQAAAVTRVTDLYSFEVVVANTSKAERKKGLINALEQVMVRATGDKRIGMHPAAAGLFGQAESYLQQYGYAERPVPPVASEEAPDAPEVPRDIFAPAVVAEMETVLQGRFEPAVLDQALRQAGLPVWDARRPIVLLLTAIEDGEQRRVASDEIVLPVLQSAAALRGLPIKTSEPGGFDANTVTRGDRFALEDAGQAAGVDYVQWSRISRQGADGADTEALLWIVEAALYQNGELAREWFFNARSEEVALRRLVDETSDWMASRYAVVSSSSGNTVIGLHVSGVDDLPDYAEVQALVNTQGSVEKIELVAIGHGTMVYRVTTRSDARQFEYGLGLRHRIKPDTAGSEGMRAPIWLGEIELFYRLQDHP